MVAWRLLRNYRLETGFGRQFVRSSGPHHYPIHPDHTHPFLGMMPASSVYGPWPASGEIDLSEARGNDMSYPLGGRDTMASTIHWGMYTLHNGYVAAAF